MKGDIRLGVPKGRTMRAPRALVSLLDMYQVDATKYFEAIVILQRAITAVERAPGPAQTEVMSPGAIQASTGNLERLSSVLEMMPLPVTKLTISDGLKEIEVAKQLRIIEYGQMLLNVSNTLRRELSSVKTFALDARRAEFYEPAEPLFGADVDHQFPSITSELDQAGKCYACDLPTAAAFHWIRCLEAGVRAITRCLGLPEPAKGKDRNWSNISAAIRDELEKRWPKSTGRMTGDAKLFDKLYGALAAMQNPYRNETMHLDATYTASEALHLSEVIKGLVVQIASRMDENGQPAA